MSDEPNTDIQPPADVPLSRPDWVTEIERDLDRGFAPTGTRIPRMLVEEIKRLRVDQALIAAKLTTILVNVRARKGTPGQGKLSLTEWQWFKTVIRLAEGEESEERGEARP
jgi:hypothetical protein